MRAASHSAYEARDARWRSRLPPWHRSAQAAASSRHATCPLEQPTQPTAFHGFATRAYDQGSRCIARCHHHRCTKTSCLWDLHVLCSLKLRGHSVIFSALVQRGRHRSMPMPAACPVARAYACLPAKEPTSDEVQARAGLQDILQVQDVWVE